MLPPLGKPHPPHFNILLITGNYEGISTKISEIGLVTRINGIGKFLVEQIRAPEGEKSILVQVPH